MTAALTLEFLGVGSAHAQGLGSASAVLLRDGHPDLMIDCGPQALERYLERFDEPPRALFITHTHLDHVGGMERLFGLVNWNQALRGRVRLYVPAPVVPSLQRRVADYPEVAAEGGVNFWDAFQLVPVSASFWHAGLRFEVFAVRHHAPDSAFGLALRGSFVFTGDTRPIPEVLSRHAAAGEPVLHDCGLVGNPSHTGIDDLEREYPEELRRRLVLYHYGSAADGEAMAARGYRVARPGDTLRLSSPAAEALQATQEELSA
jgi:ribonuclease BN (tRNA processing enzyme)